MICNYDLAVLKRETRTLKAIVTKMKQQAVILLQYHQNDLAAYTMERAKLIDALIEQIDNIDS